VAVHHDEERRVVQHAPQNIFGSRRARYLDGFRRQQEAQL